MDMVIGLEQVSLIFLVCSIGIMGPLLAMAAVPPDADQLLLVLAPPWSDQIDDAIDAAMVDHVGLYSTSFSAFVSVDGPSGMDRLANTTGVWIFNGQALAEICAVWGDE